MGVLTRESYASGVQRTLAAYTAVKMVNNASNNMLGASIIPGMANPNITLHFADDEGNAQIGTQRAWDLVSTGHYDFNDPTTTLPTVIAMVGPMWSSVTKSVALVANLLDVQVIFFSA